MIKSIIFDIDGVISDGRKYINDSFDEYKSVSYKDLDALKMLKDAGFIIGCISGESTGIARILEKNENIDFCCLGIKDKLSVVKQILEKYKLSFCDICYVGDGKYDIPVLAEVGLSICPDDAIDEAKTVSDYILKRKGGEGCLAEIYTFLNGAVNHESRKLIVENNDRIINVFEQHEKLIKEIKSNRHMYLQICQVVELIVDTYQRDGRVFICGNGGSAADAQHFAAEMVGRFYVDRKPLSAEALTANTSVLTCIGNDYSYDDIFARQIEGSARKGDVLIGITTSGLSENICKAFTCAKKKGVNTVLLTGGISEYLPINAFSDFCIKIPSKETPRIQEMHIVIEHIICEMVETIIYRSTLEEGEKNE